MKGTVLYGPRAVRFVERPSDDLITNGSGDPLSEELYTGKQHKAY